MPDPTISPEELASRALQVSSGTPQGQLSTPVSTRDYTDIMDAMGENTEANEIQYSRLAIMQSKSPEVDNQVPGYAIGQIFDNISREIYSVKGPAPWLPPEVIASGNVPSIEYALIVPIFKLPSEFIHWKDRNTEGTGMHWKTLDPNDQRVRDGSWPPLGTWKPSNEPNAKKSPPVTQNMNILCAVLNPKNPKEVKNQMIVATFAKTNFKAGKRLFTNCQSHRIKQLPYWGITYYLYTNKVQFAKGSSYVYNVAGGPLLKQINDDPSFEEVIYQLAKSLTDKRKIDPSSNDPKTIGRLNQEMIINSAVMIEEAEPEEHDADEFGGEHQGEADPFT